jgi:hypothetical protein
MNFARSPTMNTTNVCEKQDIKTPMKMKTTIKIDDERKKNFGVRLFENFT